MIVFFGYRGSDGEVYVDRLVLPRRACPVRMVAAWRSDRLRGGCSAITKLSRRDGRALWKLALKQERAA